jgi:hypothetical protein
MQSIKICLLVGVVSIASVIKAVDDVPVGFEAMGKILPEDTPYIANMKQKIVDEKWEKVPHAETQKQVTFSDQEKKKGYLVFSKHYLDLVYPATLPAPYEITKEIRIFASKGEYEPCTFSIHALRDIKDMRVTSTDLLDSSGNLIKKDNIDIRIVRNLPYRIGKENKYEINPAVLEKHEKINVKKGTTQRFWMTVKAPDNAQPGFYTATLKIESPGKSPSFLTFKLRVLPISLNEPEVDYGMCYLIPSKKGMHPENIRKHFQDMAAHGMNSVWIWPAPGIENKKGEITFDFSKTTPENCDNSKQSLFEIMDNYKKTGFTRPWICSVLNSINLEKLGCKPFSKEYDEAFIDCIKQLQKTVKDKNWPSFYLSYLDEPGNKKSSMLRAKYYWPIIRKNFPNVRILSDSTPHIFDQLDPWVDIRLYHGSYVTENEIKKTKSSKDVFGFYNYSSMGRDPKWDRFRWGFYVSRTKAKLNYAWVYAWPANKTKIWSYVFCSPDGPIPTLAWEGVREGIDDIKYITTLKKLIAKAKQSQNDKWIEKAEKAENELSVILRDIPLEGVLAKKAANALDSQTYDIYRWKLARNIMNLQQLLKQ